MKEIRIIVRCQAHPSEHAKIIRLKAKLGKRKAEEFAELIDGSSMMYIHPPGERSPIGRCAQCQAPLDCEIVETSDPPNFKGCTEATEGKECRLVHGIRSVRNAIPAR